ncbi:hypothetical protein CASFOL_007066 [Castilleja foliolosa]|uniref:Tudor domain-containing protein n=1 Tax=Castilleja foliolosa TaxID=1961234 RepID=A0ABD3E884_9LAMI
MQPFSDKELEERLSESGKSLVQPPASRDELLPILYKIEELLQKVEQSPARSMQTALSPLMKAFVKEELLKHPDVDVKVGVASCISEITRITAPDAPYDDDKMKDVFQLIVSSFENLSDTSSRSYEKRATILETVAKVRSCVIMLDLECDQMINEMFQHFLTAIRGNHAEVIFASMETIMTLVLEESEDITPDLLNPILATLKMNNEAVLPIAKKLAERVIQKSADRLRPCLAEVVKSFDGSLDDYGEVVASLCRENTDTVENRNDNISRDELVVERKSTSASPARDQVTQVAEDSIDENNSQEREDPTLIGSSKSILSNGIKTEEITTVVNSPKKADSNHQDDSKLMPRTESDDCVAQNTVKLIAKTGKSEAQEVAGSHEVPAEDFPTSTEAKPVEAAESLNKLDYSTTQPSPSHAPENEATNVVSPSQSGILCDESPSEKDSMAKRKEDLVREEIVSVDTASKKAHEGATISETNNQKGKTRSDEITDKDKELTEEGASKNEEGSRTDSEARSLHQTENLEDVVSKKSPKGGSVLKPKQQQQHDDDNASDSEARSVSYTRKLGDAASKKASKGEGVSKEKKQQHDEDNTSDSEARSLSQIRKLGDAVSKKASKGESTSKAKKQQKGKRQSDETTDKDKALTEEGAQKNDEDNTSDSEARSLKQMRNLGDAASEKASKGESTSKAKKQQQKGKKRSDETKGKDKALTEEGASQNDEGSTSDSEARLLDRTEKLGGAASKKAFKGESIPKGKKQQQKGKKRSVETTKNDKELTDEGASKNGEVNASDSEAKSLKQTEKLGGAASKKASKGGSISKAKKRQRKGKKRSDETTNKDKALTEEGVAKNDEGSSSDKEAISLDHTEDLGDASNKTEDGSSMTKEDDKKSGRVKPMLGKEALKSSAREIRAKDKVTSPRSPLKSLKGEDIQEETPRMSSKRKLTPGTEKASVTVKYGKNLVGSKVKVWWPDDKKYYDGEIASFDSAKKKHKVVYVDGDEEVLNLRQEKWHFLGDALISDGADGDAEHSSHDTSPDVQRKKKGNANAESSSNKRQKMDSSSKSKKKDIATKSGGKSKVDGKQESEIKVNNSKLSRKSVDDDDDDDDAIKPRDSQKAGGKSLGGGKSKDDSAKTPSQQPKQDNKKNANSKGKTPQSGKSVSAAGRGGTKTSKMISSSKVKETDRKEKLADLDKSRESESKSVGKKRRR